MNLSSLLGGAGVAGVAMREEEEARRIARQNQLRLENLNREDAARQQLLRNMQNLPDFGAPPVEQIPEFGGAERPRLPVLGAPTPPPPIPQAPTRQPENKPPALLPGKRSLTQGEFLALPADERKRRLDLYNKQQQAATGANARTYTGPMQAGVVAPPYVPATEDDFLLTLPTGQSTGPKTRGGPRKKAGLEAPAPTLPPAVGAVVGTGPLPTTVTGAELSGKASDILRYRVGQIPDVIQSPFIQSLVQRAQQLGVDPVAAIAISGIETSYGISKATSVQGAVGALQVTPGTFKRMKDWFTDPQKIKEYNIDQRLVDAAVRMQQGTPQGDVDAGLLLLKYNELIGVPKELWGAGYQGNADTVKKLGRPVKASDRNNLSNTDYNNIYTNLYNSVYNAMGGGEIVPLGEPITSPVAPPPGLAPAKIAVTAPAAPPPGLAPGAAPTGPGPATQLVSPRGGVDTSGVRSPSAYYIGRPDVVAYERQNLDSVYNYQRQMLIANYQAQMSAGRAYEAQAIAGQLLTLDQGYRTGRLLLDGRSAIDILEYQNDPRAVASVLSTFRNQNIDFQPVNNGTYNMLIDGQNVGNYTPTKIADMVKDYTDAEWVKARNASAADVAKMRVEAGLETEMKLVEANAQFIRDAYLEAIKGNNAVKAELAKQTGIQLFNMANGQTIIVSGDGKQLGIIDPRDKQVVDMNGVKIPLPPTIRKSQVTFR